MPEKSISFIVCSNGYGHFKRVLSVLWELKKINNDISLSVYVSRHLYNYFSNITNLSGINGVEFRFDFTDFEFRWLSEDGLHKYKNWISALSENCHLSRSSLIVSDNYILPVKNFPKTILMGSFLWPFIIDKTNNTFEEIIEYELSWLSINRTKLLCVDDMVMRQDLLNYVELVGLSWFTERENPDLSRDHARPKILITGGGTGKLSDEILEIAINIHNSGGISDIFLDAKLFSKAEENQIRLFKLFDFKNTSFRSLSAVVCRPGIGILTDCIKFNLPIFAISDGKNKEINHNGQRIEELGLGYKWSIEDHNTSAISQKIVALLFNETIIQNSSNNLIHRSIGGAKEAAKLIIQEVYE
jgi:hypothetical protein